MGNDGWQDVDTSKWTDVATPPPQQDSNPLAAASKATGLSAVPSRGSKVADWIEKQRQRLQTKVTTGSQSGAGEFMASAPLGAMKVAEGVAEAGTGKVWQGTKDVVSGGLQAGEMPALMYGGPTEDLSQAIPSTARAGQKFENVMQAAKNVSVDVEGPGKQALRAGQLVERGSNPVGVITKFMRRVTDPSKGPLTYEEARDFYTNTRLSMGERLMSKPNMWRQVTMFKEALGQAIEDAAAEAGKLEEYQSAMQEYRNAKRLAGLGVTAGAAAAGKAITKLPVVGTALRGMVKGSLGN